MWEPKPAAMQPVGATQLLPMLLPRIFGSLSSGCIWLYALHSVLLHALLDVIVGAALAGYGRCQGFQIPL